MRKFTIALVLLLMFTGCKRPHPTFPPKPMKSAVQPRPSWGASMEPECFIVGSPVPDRCMEDPSAERCATEDGNDGAGRPCFWVDPSNGRVWYRP